MVSDLKTFAHKGYKIAAEKKSLSHFSSHLLTPFKRLFAHTSQSPRSKFFLWGEVMERNGLKFENVYSKKALKSPVKKKNVGEFCLSSRILLVLVLLSEPVERLFVSRMRDFFYMICVAVWSCIIM